jgi:hypothetical protein
MFASAFVKSSTSGSIVAAIGAIMSARPSAISVRRTCSTTTAAAVAAAPFFSWCWPSATTTTEERRRSTYEPGKHVDCMLRYDGIERERKLISIVRRNCLTIPTRHDGIDVLKTDGKSGFQMAITEKPYAPSSLAAQIEAESDLDNRIPENARQELMPSTLIAWGKNAIHGEK